MVLPMTGGPAYPVPLMGAAPYMTAAPPGQMGAAGVPPSGDKAPGVSLTGGLTRAASPVRGGAGPAASAAPSLMPVMPGASAPPEPSADPTPVTGRTGSPASRPQRAPPTVPPGGLATPDPATAGGGGVSITGRAGVPYPQASVRAAAPYATMPYPSHAGAAALLYQHAAAGLPYATMLPPANTGGGAGIALMAYPRTSLAPVALPAAGVQPSAPPPSNV